MRELKIKTHRRCKNNERRPYAHLLIPAVQKEELVQQKSLLEKRLNRKLTMEQFIDVTLNVVNKKFSLKNLEIVEVKDIETKPTNEAKDNGEQWKKDLAEIFKGHSNIIAAVNQEHFELTFFPTGFACLCGNENGNEFDETQLFQKPENNVVISKGCGLNYTSMTLTKHEQYDYLFHLYLSEFEKIKSDNFDVKGANSLDSQPKDEIHAEKENSSKNGGKAPK